MTDLFFGTSGPRNARIAIVGESWGTNERNSQLPFVGAAGGILSKLLEESGIQRSGCFITNCFADQPMNDEAWRFFEKGRPAGREHWGLYPSPWAKSELDRLGAQLREVRPDLVICAGNYSMWAVTGAGRIAPTKEKKTNKSTGVLGPVGIVDWRGSMIQARPEMGGGKALPIIHPAGIMNQWAWRAPTKHDLTARVPLALSNQPDWRPIREATFLAPPSFSDAVSFLDSLLAELDHALVRGQRTDIVSDVETIPSASLLVCIGLASRLDLACSIPFIRIEGGAIDSYWSIQQEAALTGRIRRVLLHPAASLVGQNYLYDWQWTRRDLGIDRGADHDTMLAQHLLWPGTPKSLDYNSSLYCHYHRFWKDDSKEWYWKETGLEQELKYNCEDLIRTLEIKQEQVELIERMGMSEQWEWQKAKDELARSIMRRGIRVDHRRREAMGRELMFSASQIEAWLDRIFPNSIFGSGSDSPWWDSPKQTMPFLYNDLGLRQVLHRKTKRPSSGKEAMEELAHRYPRLEKLFHSIRALRSVGTFHSHFIRAPLEAVTLRMVTSFGQTETFRWSSTENAFGEGTNLQNLPTGNEDED